MKNPLLFFCAVVLVAKGVMANEDVSVYTLHIGINAAPEGSLLPTLRYADDDAMKMFLFMDTFSKESILSTELDADSEAVFGHLGSARIAPRSSDIAAALERIAQMMRGDRSEGRRVILYFTYSGHGEQVDNGTRMLLEDGFIDKAWLKDNILSLPADVVHLIIDACYAEGIVDTRGVVKTETDAAAKEITIMERAALTGEDILTAYPHVGALVSSSSDTEAYEWSELGSGVFTHELLSAFAGAADANGDGEIAYSEVSAFISAANRSVAHIKARPRIVSFPPMIDQNLPLISFDWAPTLSFLKGHPHNLKRFYIETDTGRRLVDAHPEPSMPLRLVIPAGERLWITQGNQTASFKVGKHNTLDIASLKFAPTDDPTRRGGMATALQNGLFATQFGPEYFAEWMDSEHDTVEPVSTKTSTAAAFKSTDISFAENAEPDTGRRARFRRALPTALFVGGGVLLAASGVFVGLGVHAKKEFDSTNIEKEAHDEKEKSQRFSALAIGFGAAAVASGVVGAIVRQYAVKRQRRLSLMPSLSAPGGGLMLTVSGL